MNEGKSTTEIDGGEKLITVELVPMIEPHYAAGIHMKERNKWQRTILSNEAMEESNNDWVVVAPVSQPLIFVPPQWQCLYHYGTCTVEQ